MAFTFKPAVYRNATLYELPRPILSLRVQDAWDFAQWKIPLRDGDTLAGHSRAGVDIAVDGSVGTQAGSLKSTEQTMLEEIEALRAALDVDSANLPFDFFLFHDAATSTYRRFTDCSTVRFEFDLSSPQLFSYSLVIHAEDPTLYTTLPT